MSDKMPDRIWVYADEGAFDAGEWDTDPAGTPYTRSDLVSDAVKALERFNRGGITLFGDEEDVPITFKGKDFQALRAALTRIKEAT